MTEYKFTCKYCGSHNGSFEDEFGEWKHKNLLECIGILKDAKNEEIKEIQHGFEIQRDATFNFQIENTKLKQDIARIDTLAQKIIYKSDGIYPMGIDDIREIACAWIIESLQERK